MDCRNIFRYMYTCMQNKKEWNNMSSMEVFSHSWKITVFPQLAPSNCPACPFVVFFKTPIRDKSRVVPSIPSHQSPAKETNIIPYISVSKISWPVRLSLSQPAYNIYVQPSSTEIVILQNCSRAYPQMSFVTTEKARRCCSKPHHSPLKPLPCISNLGSNHLVNSRMLSWMWKLIVAHPQAYL